jgi:hypothetical protein
VVTKESVHATQLLKLAKICFIHQPKAPKNIQTWTLQLKLPEQNYVDTIKDFHRCHRMFINDFCFLEIENPDHEDLKNVTMALPRIQLTPGPVIAVGYPGALTEQEFIDKFKNETEELKIRAKPYFTDTNKLFSSSFENKTISFNTTYSPSENNLILHTCPTTGGMSGGIFAQLTGTKPSVPYFIGICVGGKFLSFY